MRERNRRISRIYRGILGLGGGLVLILGLGLSSAESVYDYQDTVDGVHLPPVQAIVVLAGGRGRIAAAGDIWNRYRERSEVPAKASQQTTEGLPVLYVSGVGPQSTFKVIQGQLRPGVTEVIRPDQVVIENESTNTEENALWLARYARERSWNRVLLITSSYHMKRARLIFSRILERDAADRNALRANQSPRAPSVQVDTLSVYQEPFEPGEWMTSVHGTRVTIGEYFKWLYYTRFWEP